MGWKRIDRSNSIDRSDLDPLPTKDLYRANRIGCLLYYVLYERAEALGVEELTISRQEIADMIGIHRLATISHALTALAKASWIIKDVYNSHDGDGVMRSISIRFCRPFGTLPKKNNVSTASADL